MVHYGPQYLYARDSDGGMSELVNGARTALLLASSNLCGSGRFSNVLNYGGCLCLTYEPTCTEVVEPILALDSREYSGSGSWQNLGTGGATLAAAPGATTAAPTWRDWNGENYMTLPGVASNN